MLSSSPTRTLPPASAAMATYGSCIGPIENAENTQPAGSWPTIVMRVVGSSGAPYGMPMQSWMSAGSSIRPSPISSLTRTRWPLSKTSSSGRTPSAWILRAIARRIPGVLTST